MRRGDFLKEMGGSLLQTMKSVYEPFVHEDLERVEDAADRVLGITWMPLLNPEELYTDLEMKFLAGKPIIVDRLGSNMQAWNGVCPVCSNIIILTTLYSSGKCLNCQKEFNFKTQTGELHLELLPSKIKEKLFLVGFQRNRNDGDPHA